MRNRPTPVTDSLVVARHPAKASQLTGKGPGADPRQFTRTIYDENGKLLDDGSVRDAEKSYWESFVDPDQARVLERRLALIESPDYIPGSQEFLDMDLEVEEDDDE